MSILYILLASVIFLLASILSLSDDPPVGLFLSAIYLVLLAIYYQKKEE